MHISIKKKTQLLYSHEQGQVMILTIIMLGGILLSATAIAGLLVTYQIKQANDIVNSTKAFFAADTGLEIISWCYFKGCPPDDAANPPQIIFGESAVSYEVVSTLTETILRVVSTGYAKNGDVIRILEAEFE